MEKIIIRRIQGKDIEKLQTLYSKHLYHRGSYQVRLSITKPHFWAKTVCKRLYIQYIFDIPLRLLGMETLVCATAEADNGEIVGSAVARRQHPFAKTWRLGSVVVHAEYRGLGIATRMVNFIFEQLKAKKAKELTLIVNTYSTAKILYKKLGFRSLEKFYVTYGRIQYLPVLQCTSRKNVDIYVKKISTRAPYESFRNFCFKKMVSTFLRVFFKEFPHSESLIIFEKDKVIGFLKVDNSKFIGVSIIEEVLLHPDFQEKGVIKEILKSLFETLKKMMVKKIVFQIIVNSIDPVFLRNILLELKMRRVTTYDIMSRALESTYFARPRAKLNPIERIRLQRTITQI